MVGLGSGIQTLDAELWMPNKMRIRMEQRYANDMHYAQLVKEKC